jgi:PAS domain S-box-containing protein
LSTEPVPIRPWFSADQQGALLDYWNVYEAHYDEIQRRSMTQLKVHPTFGPMIAAMPPEVLAQQNAESRALMSRAIRGAWGEYEANLRVQGAMYARMGISFAAWHDIIRMFLHHLTPVLVRTYLAEPDRLSAALLVMQDLLDRAMGEIAQAYLDTKSADLRASEENLRITLDSIGDAVIATDASGRITRMNPVAEALTGWPADDAVGRPLADAFRIVNEDTGATVESPVDRVLRDGAIVGLANHTALIARDGSTRAIADSGAPIRGDDGALRGVVLVFRDQTAERAAEAALRESEMRFRRLSDSGIVGIVLADTNGGIHDANDAFLDMLGYTRDDLREGRLRPSELTPLEWAPQQAEARAELAANGVCKPWEKEFFRKDGSRVPVLLAVTMLEPPDCLNLVLDLTAQKAAEDAVRDLRDDITARKRAEAELRRARDEAERASQELEAFSYSVAHDLRAPLRAIHGFSVALVEDVGDRLGPEATHALARIQAGAARMGELIDALLSLARVSRADPQREAVNLGELARASVAQLQAGDAGRVVELVVADDLLADGDPRLLRVLFDNLLGNAWKFTSKRASARIVVGRAPGADVATWFVRDNGAGFDMQYASRLFAPFQRMHRESDFAGTGIGLATVQRIVNRHGGTVWAESAVDQGATFYFTLERGDGAANVG